MAFFYGQSAQITLRRLFGMGAQWAHRRFQQPRRPGLSSPPRRKKRLRKRPNLQPTGGAITTFRAPPLERGSRSAETCLRVDALEPELHDEPKLSLSEQWLQSPDEPEYAADLYPLTDLNRPLLCQVTRRDQVLAAPELVPLCKRGHLTTSLPSLISRAGPARSMGGRLDHRATVPAQLEALM